MTWDEGEEIGADSLQKLTGLCEEIVEHRKRKDEKEEELKSINDDIRRCESKIIEYFKEYGLPSIKTEVGNFTLTKRRNVAQPASPEAREAFFEYLREKGIFEDMVSVNSRTLTSWAIKEIEEQEEQGNIGWVPPGLEAPSEYETLSIRKK